MNDSARRAGWSTVNQQQLGKALERIRGILERYVAQRQNSESNQVEQEPSQPLNAEEPEEWMAGTALEVICRGFNLTAFETDILLLCAGVELSASLASLCATIQGDARFAYPTFSLALAVFPDADWSALAPVSPLRHWRLIEVANGDSLTQSRLRMDERVLHYLNGVPYLDDRLRGLIQPAPIPSELPGSYQALCEQLIEFWSQVSFDHRFPIVQLCGEERAGKEAIAAMACALLGMQLQMMRAADIPTSGAEREALVRLWEREATLDNSVLLVDCEALNNAEQRAATLRFLEAVDSMVVVTAREPLRDCNRSILRLDVNRLSATEQRYLWQDALASHNLELNGQVEQVVAQFNLSPATIRMICAELRIKQASLERQAEQTAIGESLWNACRVQARMRLDDLAQRIQPIATWTDLVLPPEQHQLLQEIAAQVRQRTQVYEVWEFAVRGSNGLGISALFAGASGTGKTMAAEVLANELRLDLYRIDLSQVVSKYIGETEKNLRRVFDAAEAGGAILLFDEADALFGKRSEVKDSHDRYANIEVSYLLQRMEAYRGLAILTTNLKQAIDTAFLRRIRFVVQFPFPDVSQRMEIWRRMFPPKLPTEGLDFNRLARLNVAGGNIRNIALNAAFLAADAGEPLQMKHLLRSAHSEYGKLEKSLTTAEVGGWV